jgi:hypothetical protein
VEVARGVSVRLGGATGALTPRAGLRGSPAVSRFPPVTAADHDPTAHYYCGPKLAVVGGGGCLSDWDGAEGTQGTLTRLDRGA